MGTLLNKRGTKMLVEKPAPENLRKKTDRDSNLAKKLTAAREQRSKDVADKKKEWLKRGKTHHDNYVNEQKRLVDCRRKANANGEIFVEVDPKSKLILRLLTLRQMHNATFVKVNKAIMNMLQRVQPWVTYGSPNRKTVENQIYKRGYGKVNKQRVRLSNNFIIE